MAYESIMSVPVSRKRQAAMRRRFIAFSSVLFLIILVSGTVAFVLLMLEFRQNSARGDLVQTVELERHKLEAWVGSDIAIVLKMATSPVIQRYFMNPGDSGMAGITLRDIDGYRDMLSTGSLFWVNDRDRKFILDGKEAYTVDPADTALYWYNMTMYETEKYNFNIDYDPHLDVTNIWMNAPVSGPGGEPLGILGTGMNLSSFIDTIYQSYGGGAKLYFFNNLGEITGARDHGLAAGKVGIDKELGRIGADILAGMGDLKAGDIKFFEIRDEGMRGMAALARIPALDWYVAAVHSYTIADTLNNGMTALFAVMMGVIFLVFVVFNIFLIKLLGPLYHMVKKIGKLALGWDQRPHSAADEEVKTLGEFLNMTIVDELTGIHSRRYFDESVKETLGELSKSGGKLSVLVVDIDFFKNYNDTYGRDMGDNCLRGVAAALNHCMDGDGCFVARYDGDKFVAVLPNTGEEEARQAAERLLRRVHDCCIPHAHSYAGAYVTVSIGGATGAPGQYPDAGGYLERAGTALARSRHYGGNQYAFENF
ncbi:MAG: sensor domain-containing diguanylate cyclase [Chitinispirillia bacterium]|nr:sensor domain-containing diguanylate cyclase [Chitinispirillia bacterium]MCL2241858.1 sensor domain-containing diguanylate cyclase [Chitinispirillia bacterium]